MANEKVHQPPCTGSVAAEFGKDGVGKHIWTYQGLLGVPCQEKLHFSCVYARCCGVLHNICELDKEHFLSEWHTEQPVLPEPDYLLIRVHKHKLCCIKCCTRFRTNTLMEVQCTCRIWPQFKNTIRMKSYLQLGGQSSPLDYKFQHSPKRKRAAQMYLVFRSRKVKSSDVRSTCPVKDYMTSLQTTTLSQTFYTLLIA